MGKVHTKPSGVHFCDTGNVLDVQALAVVMLSARASRSVRNAYLFPCLAQDIGHVRRIDVRQGGREVRLQITTQPPHRGHHSARETPHTHRPMPSRNGCGCESVAMSWYAAATTGAAWPAHAFWSASLSGLHSTSGVGYAAPRAAHCAAMSFVPAAMICARASSDDMAGWRGWGGTAGAGRADIRRVDWLRAPAAAV